jgi:hemolysin activation/secretion protein
MNSTGKPLIILSLLVSTFSSTSLLAAEVPPSNASPGAVIQSIQAPTVDSQRNKQKPKQEVVEEEAKTTENQTSTQVEEQKVFIKEVKVEGVTLLSPFVVKNIASKYEDRDLTFSQLQELASKITELYRDKGFITSRVYLPPQAIEGGILKLQASEGDIRPITLEEGKFYKDRAVFPRLKIDERRKLNVDKIKNDLARLNENPDLGLQANLRPGPDSGQTEVRLKARDHFPVHVTPFVDNLGRRLIGENRGGFSLTHNNLLGFGDRDTASLTWSKSSFGISNGYEIPVGKYGTKLGFNYAHSRLKLGKEFSPLNVKGFATVYSPYISQELYRGKHVLASADLAFDFKNLGTDILGQTFSRDRLRVLRPGINFDEFDNYGRTSMRHEIGVGLFALGASDRYGPYVSRQGAGGNFFRYTGYGTRVQKLPFGMIDIFRVVGQFSPDRLNSAEQMQVGGAFTVRGYKEGQLIGDSGLVISNEVRIPAYIFPKSWKIPVSEYGVPTFMSLSRKTANEYVLRDNIQLVAFSDYGVSRTNGVISPIKPTTYALGTGVGLRVRLTKFFTGRFDVGFPLIRNLPNRQDLTIHFGLQTDIL